MLPRASGLWESAQDCHADTASLPRVPRLERLHFGPFPYYVPSFFVFFPKYQFPGVAVQCPECESCDVTEGVWCLVAVSVRRNIGTASWRLFNATSPPCTDLMPIYVRDSFPVLLTRESG